MELRSLAREFDLGGVILFSRNIEAPEQVAELVGRERSARPDDAGVGQRRSGGRPRGAPEGAVHQVAADGDAGPRRQGSRRRWPSGSPRRSPRSCWPSASRLDYAPVLDIHTNPKNPVIGDRALAERAEDVAEARPRDHPRAAGRRPGRLRQAFSRSRRHQHRFAFRAAARRARAGSPAGDRVRAVPRRDRRAGRVHHDRARAGAVARRAPARHAVAGRSCRNCCATS